MAFSIDPNTGDPTYSAPTQQKTTQPGGVNFPMPPAWSNTMPVGQNPATTTIDYGSTGTAPSTPQPFQTAQKTAATDTVTAWSPDPKQGFLQMLNAGNSGESAVNSANQFYGLPYGGGFAYYADKNVYATPGGGYYAIGPDGKWGWNPGDSGGGGGAGAGGGVGAYVPGSGVAGMGTLFGAGTPGSTDAASMYKLLTGIATGSTPESSNPNYAIDPNDPIIKNQVDAYRANETDAMKNYLSGLAEEGGPNTNISAETRAANEGVAKDVSGFQATLMGNELAARRSEVQNALNGAYGFLTNEQQMQLQEELAQLQLAESATESNTNFQLRGMGL